MTAKDARSMYASAVDERPADRPNRPRSEACWAERAACRGWTEVFFATSAERPEARRRREMEARRICLRCPVLDACRGWARTHQEYGFWGGESEEERAAVEYPGGRRAEALDVRVPYRLRRERKWRTVPPGVGRPRGRSEGDGMG